jgi:hypothetical protein
MWEMQSVRELAIKYILKLMSSNEEWKEMLKMCTSLGISEIRKEAIRRLSGLHVMDRILLAREWRVQEWLLGGYRELVQRSQTISKEDERQLGLETTVTLFRLRERYRQNSYRHQTDGAVENDIRTQFSRELEDAKM